MLTLRTFGGIELHRGEASILPRRRKELVLLAFLARRSPRGVTRAELAALLWGHRDESRARHSLRQSLSELKAELGDSLEITPESVRLPPGAIELDLRAFETAVEAGREEEAAKLWQGDFLAGCEDLGAEELRTWIEQERAGLQAQLARVYRRLVDRARASGDWRSAIARAEEWCRALPYDEDAHRSAVETLRIAGKNAEAAARHAGFVTRLRTELDTSPSEEFVRLGDTLDPAPELPRRGRRGLLTPDLVGRSEALGRLQQVWAEAAGGPGTVALILGDEGYGKSRLCTELARRVEAGSEPATVIQARAFAAERDRPWALIRPLLEALAGAPGFRAAPGAVLATAAGIAPEIRELLPRLQPASDASPVEAVSRIIAEVAAERPLLLIIDDVSAADATSLEVIRGLVRRPPPGLLLILAAAPGSLSASGLELDLRQASAQLTRVDLEPLSRQDIELMLASMMPLAPDASTRLSTHLLRASSGNPGRIEPFLFAWMDAGVLATGADGRWELTREPDGVRRRWGLMAGAAAALLLLLVWGLTRPGAASVGQGDLIVLADVQNATSDSALGRAFYSAATIGLQGSRHLSLFPRSRVRETLGRMGRSRDDSTLSEAVAREVAVREGVSRVVALGVTQVDSAYLLSARVVDPETGRDLDALSQRVERRAELLEGMDRLLQRTRKTLGESSRELRANPEPLPRVTTSSLDALRAYVAGGDAWSRRDLVAAQEHWGRAIALDSNFALALAAMADLFYSGHNDRPAGDRWMNRALAQLHRLTEREQLRLQGQAALGRRQDAAAVDFARLLAERYPTRDTWYNHGTVLMRQYRCREAIPSIRRALAFDSLFTNGHLNLATCLQIEGPVESALEAYAAAGRSDSLVLFRANINHEWGTALVKAGRLAAAESAYVRMTGTGTAFDRARGFRSLAWLEMYRGRFRQAVSHLNESLKLYQSGSPNSSVFRNQVILAQAHLTLGDTARARRQLDSAMATARALTLDPAFQLYLGQAQLRAGRFDAARKALVSVREAIRTGNAWDRAVLQALEAPLLLAEGRVTEAIETAATEHDPRTAAFRLSALAQAHGAAGQLDSALAVAVRLSNTFAFGEEAQIEWARGPLLVARFAEAKGDSATARAAYSRLIEQWKTGDPDLPDLVLARRALARLQRRER